MEGGGSGGGAGGARRSERLACSASELESRSIHFSAAVRGVGGVTPAGATVWRPSMRFDGPPFSLQESFWSDPASEEGRPKLNLPRPYVSLLRGGGGGARGWDSSSLTSVLDARRPCREREQSA